jgi:hypothetical protein
MSQFGMAASDFGSISDRLQAAANASTTSVDLIGESLSYVGPQANMAGQSFDDVAAALGALAQGGIRGSMAGTQLARVLEAMAGEEAKFNALGVSVRDTAGNLRPFMDVLRDLGTATAGMNNADRMQAFMDIFDIRGARAAATLSQLRGEFDRILGVVQNSAGAAAGKARQVLESFGGQVQILAAKFEDLKVSVITSMGQTASSAVAGLGKVLGFVTRLIERNPTLVATVAGVSGAMLGLGISITAVGLAVGVMGKSLAVLRILPALLTPIGMAVAGIAGGVTIATMVARELSPAFKRETDAIWQAITQLDFASAWQLLNIGFAIALTQMTARADEFIGFVQGAFAAAGSFIGDKLTEGLDRFMGIFGADILTMQAGLQRLGVYLRAAFDWKWAATGMRAALDEIDAQADKARKRAPTASARADERAATRQREADDRQRDMDSRQAGWRGTVAELEAERQRVKDGLNPKQAETPAAGSVPARVPVEAGAITMPAASAAATSTAGIGRSVGTFGSGVGLQIGPELANIADPARETAENTAAAAASLRQIADQAVGGNAAAVVQGQIPAASAAASRGANEATQRDSAIGRLFADAGAKIVEAIQEHKRISEGHTQQFDRMIGALSGLGGVFV